MLENTEVTGLPAPTELAPVANPDEVQNPGQATAAEGEGDQPQEQVEQPKKTFSQEEVDALIQKRLTKEARRSERLMAQKLAEMQSQLKPATKAEPKREDFIDDEAHQRAQLEHVIEQRATERAKQIAEELQTQQQRKTAQQQFWERVDEAQERFPDIQRVLSDATLPVSQAMVDFAFESEIGPELLYAMDKNRSRAAQISQMGPIQAARALMTLESELKAKPKAQPSKAPDPINPVGNRGTAARSSAPSDDDDMETWVRKERERLAKRR